jgi:peptide/nickel transport system permease protein
VSAAPVTRPDAGPGRWWVLLSLVAPGAPQLLGGRAAAGFAALASWSVGVWALALQRDRLVAAFGGPADAGVAAVAALALAALAWAWSLVDVRRDPTRVLARGPLAGDRLATAGLLVLGASAGIAVLAPLLAPYDPTSLGSFEPRVPPSWAHLFGTDRIGRDVFSRLLYGARISLSIGLLAMGISMTLGTLMGAIAGFRGGWIDSVLMRLTDLVLAFPRLVLLIALVAVFSPSMTTLVLVIGLTQWPTTARLVRAEVLSLREREFIQAARALGFSRSRILLRHLVPNTLAPVIVAGTLGVGNVIVLEAGLSFLGLGIEQPVPSWGSMIADGRTDLLTAWWLTTFPGLAIVTVVLAFNVVGDGLRDALDPRLRGRL